MAFPLRYGSVRLPVTHESSSIAHTVIGRSGDIIQAALAAVGPVPLGFTGDAEARHFYSQAPSEVGVIAATDWEAVDEQAR